MTYQFIPILLVEFNFILAHLIFQKHKSLEPQFHSWERQAYTPVDFFCWKLNSEQLLQSLSRKFGRESVGNDTQAGQPTTACNVHNVE